MKSVKGQSSLRSLTLITLHATGLWCAAAANVYVDACAPGPGSGMFWDPYNSVSVAAFAASPGSTLVLKSGSYLESPIIQKNLILTASGGPALIGGVYVASQDICVPVTNQDCGWSNPDPAVFCDGSTDEVPIARARMYYPLRCGESLPLIIYAHGNRNCPPCEEGTAEPYTEDYLHATGLLVPLAAAGFIVISVDVSWANVGGDALKASIILNTLVFARQENARAGSPVRGMIDLARVGLLGHSMGGAAAAEVHRWLRSRFPCVLDLGLADIGLGALALLASASHSSEPVQAPLLVMYGDQDTGQGWGDHPMKTYGDATGPKHLVYVTGANHYGYTDDLCCADSDGPCEVGGVSGSQARRLQQQSARNYVRAFFSVYLKGDHTQLDYLLQQRGEQCSYPGNPPACGAPLRAFTDLAGANVHVSICSCAP